MTDAFRPDVTAGKFNRDLFDLAGDNLLVNEVFYSVQGEGGNAGRAAVFVRMAKCNLACKFCDTEFEVYRRRPVEQLSFDISDVMAASIGAQPPSALTPTSARPLVVITGGEPLLQNCARLVAWLHSAGFDVAVETNGTVFAPWVAEVDHVCISPKVPLARVPRELLDVATEIKWVVNGAFLSMLERGEPMFYDGKTASGKTVINYLQPESLNPKFTTAATKLVMAHPTRYRLSLQTHKLAGVP